MTGPADFPEKFWKKSAGRKIEINSSWTTVGLCCRIVGLISIRGPHRRSQARSRMQPRVFEVLYVQYLGRTLLLQPRGGGRAPAERGLPRIIIAGCCGANPGAFLE
jgi:hypothetical protein